MPPKKVTKVAAVPTKRARDGTAVKRQHGSLLEEFNSPLKAKHRSLSWVGNYKTTHTTGIQIGYSQKEAMVLTVLLSYYQGGKGDKKGGKGRLTSGVPCCPVAMISGPGSFGRKLAIHFLPTKPNVVVPPKDAPRKKASLVQGIKEQSLVNAAQFGRADLFLQKLQKLLRLGIRDRSSSPNIIFGIIPGTQGRHSSSRLVLDEYKLFNGRLIPEFDSTWIQIRQFIYEVLSSGHVDVADLLLRKIKFESIFLRLWATNSQEHGHCALVKMVLKQLFEQLPEDPLCFEEIGQPLLLRAIKRQDLEMVKTLTEDAMLNLKERS